VIKKIEPTPRVGGVGSGKEGLAESGLALSLIDF